MCPLKDNAFINFGMEIGKIYHALRILDDATWMTQKKASVN